jgi:hypothetical protein
MRILLRGSFSFANLLEKRKRLISPPTYFISIVPDIALLD